MLGLVRTARVALAQRRFEQFVGQNRFAAALAAVAPEQLPTLPDHLWALYRLGCYRTVAESGYAPVTGKDAVARCASLAAVGRGAEARRVARDATLRRTLRGERLVDAAKAVAPFDARLAADLLGQADGHPAFRIALLENIAPDVAQRLLAEAVTGQLARQEPELCLLEANATSDPERVLELLNQYLAHFELAPVAKRNSAQPATPDNLRSAADPVPISGPLVTVVMAAFNTQARIGNAVRSLLGQSYRNIEVVVVDDASTDGTADVVAALAREDPRVRLLRQPRNHGPYAARNRALVDAGGEFVTCHDSDDWAHPEKIERQVAPLLDDRRLALTLSNWVRVTDTGRFHSRSCFPLCRLNPASPMVRRAALMDRVGFYENVRTGADSEYISRLKHVFGRSGWRQIKSPLAIGAHREGSLTTDPATGSASGAMSAQRLDYWEDWTARHIETLRRRGSFYVPAPEGSAG